MLIVRSATSADLATPAATSSSTVPWRSRNQAGITRLVERKPTMLRRRSARRSSNPGPRGTPRTARAPSRTAACCACSGRRPSTPHIVRWRSRSAPALRCTTCRPCSSRRRRAQCHTSGRPSDIPRRQRRWGHTSSSAARRRAQRHGSPRSRHTRRIDAWRCRTGGGRPPCTGRRRCKRRTRPT